MGGGAIPEQTGTGSRQRFGLGGLKPEPVRLRWVPATTPGTILAAMTVLYGTRTEAQMPDGTPAGDVCGGPSGTGRSGKRSPPDRGERPPGCRGGVGGGTALSDLRDRDATRTAEPRAAKRF